VLLRVWLVSTVLSLAMTCLLISWGRSLVHPHAPQGIVSFELARTPEKMRAVLAGWDAETRRAARQITLVDFAYLVLYGTAMASAALLLGAPFAGTAFGLAVCASSLDALENAVGLAILAGSEAAFLPGLMAAAAAVKFLLIGAVLLYLAGGAGRALLIRGRAGRAR